MSLSQLPFYFLSGGIATPLGTLLPPGSEIRAYVSSNTTYANDLPSEVRGMLRSTLNAGLALCRSGRGDVVVVLPGHTENISSADQMSSLVAGTKIVGLGEGAMRPTLTWTLAAGTFLFDVANVSLTNFRLFMAGPTTSTTAITVAAPITVSASGCAIRNCYIDFGVDADQIVTVGVTTTAAGDDFVFEDNVCIGATAAECTTFLRLVGADRAVIRNNRITGATSNVVVGLVQFVTTDSLNVLMDKDNFIRNNKAASSAAVSVSAGATSSSGYVNELYMTVLDDAAGNLILGDAVGAFGLSVASFTFGRHVYVANLAGERMAEVTAVSA